MKINPHYVSAVLGPLALAVAKNQGREPFSSVDYSSREQGRVVIESLILPNFRRLKDSTKLQVAKALAYFIINSNAVEEVIEAKLLLCEIPPIHHINFLRILWENLFPGETAAAVAKEVRGVVYRPLAATGFASDKTAVPPLDELIADLCARLQGNGQG